MNKDSKQQTGPEPGQSPISRRHRIVGWIFMSGYLVIATLAFYEAKNCTGMLCDLVALPALFPFGFMFYWLIDSNYFSYPTSSGIPGDHLRSWYFILPTLAVNAIFFYWAGRTLVTLARWARKVARR